VDIACLWVGPGDHDVTYFLLSFYCAMDHFLLCPDSPAEIRTDLIDDESAAERMGITITNNQ
jgi:hypothetical protein